MRIVGPLVAFAFALAAGPAEASVGLIQIAAKDGLGVVTVYYPSTSEAQTLKRGPFTFQMAAEGAPARGNGRLIAGRLPEPVSPSTRTSSRPSR